MALTQHIQCRRLAKLLDVSPRTIRHWANDPVAPLPSKKIKGVLLFDAAEVQTWMTENEQRAVDIQAMTDEIVVKMKGRKHAKAKKENPK